MAGFDSERRRRRFERAKKATRKQRRWVSFKQAQERQRRLERLVGVVIG